MPERPVMLWRGHSDSDMVRHYYQLRNGEARRHASRLVLRTEAVSAFQPTNPEPEDRRESPGSEDE